MRLGNRYHERPWHQPGQRQQDRAVAGSNPGTHDEDYKTLGAGGAIHRITLHEQHRAEGEQSPGAPNRKMGNGSASSRYPQHHQAGSSDGAGPGQHRGLA